MKPLILHRFVKDDSLLTLASARAFRRHPHCAVAAIRERTDPWFERPSGIN